MLGQKDQRGRCHAGADSSIIRVTQQETFYTVPYLEIRSFLFAASSGRTIVGQGVEKPFTKEGRIFGKEEKKFENRLETTYLPSYKTRIYCLMI